MVDLDILSRPCLFLGRYGLNEGIRRVGHRILTNLMATVDIKDNSSGELARSEEVECLQRTIGIITC